MLLRLYFAILIALAVTVSCRAAELGSWKAGESRNRIIQFVKNSTNQTSDKYIPPSDRIVVLDNDGTLWDEKPVPVELSFTFDQVKRLGSQHPEWKTQQPFQAVLEGNYIYFSQLNEREKVQQALKLVAATHSGMSVDRFEAEVKQWFARARDGKSRAPYTQRVYAPMQELLSYFRSNGFKTYIVTGGDTDFVRAVSQKLYGIPPEQVIGTSFQTQWVNKDGRVAIMRTAKVQEPFDDRSGKPLNIHRVIGRIPVVAVGNSDGDLEMLQYAASGSKPSLEMTIRHDDRAREAAYDQGAGQILAEARKNHWVIVSMKKDFKRVFGTASPSARQLGGKAGGD